MTAHSTSYYSQLHLQLCRLTHRTLQLPLQHSHEAVLHRFSELRSLPHAIQIQTYARSSHRHSTHGIPTRSLRHSRSYLQLPLVSFIIPSFSITTHTPYSSPSEVLWAFSIYLEAVGILPQLFMLQRTGEAETITTHYLFALGAYRALYVPNWVYRYFTEDTVDPIAIVAGLVQTALFSDFFYIYFTKCVPLSRLYPRSTTHDTVTGSCAERNLSCQFVAFVAPLRHSILTFIPGVMTARQSK